MAKGTIIKNGIEYSGGGETNVIDSLNSTSTKDALSANQGRVLNEKVADIYDSGFASINLLDATLGSTLQSGIAITRNSDGSYTVNGTTTAQIVLQLGSLTNNGKYKLVGCPSGGSQTTYMLQVNDSGTWGGIDSGDGLLIEVSSSLDLYLIIRNGVTLNNLLFKPMITKYLNATYSDYQPYAKNNSDLTTLTNNVISDKWTSGTYASGTLKIHNNKLWRAKTQTNQEPSASASDWEEKTLGGLITEASNYQEGTIVASDGVGFSDVGLTKFQNQVSIQFALYPQTMNINQYEGKIIGTIPEGFRPKRTELIGCPSADGTFYYVRLGDTGQITIQPINNSVTLLQYIAINLMYFI